MFFGQFKGNWGRGERIKVNLHFEWLIFSLDKRGQRTNAGVGDGLATLVLRDRNEDEEDGEECHPEQPHRRLTPELVRHCQTEVRGVRQREYARDDVVHVP